MGNTVKPKGKVKDEDDLAKIDIRHKYDEFIILGFFQVGVSGKKLAYLNKCHLYLQVMTFANYRYRRWQLNLQKSMEKRTGPIPMEILQMAKTRVAFGSCMDGVEKHVMERTRVCQWKVN